MKKKCLACGNLVLGRSDKIFCSSDCRSHHHNIKNQAQKKTFLKINSRLKANRKVLQKLKLLDINKISRNAILKQGFDFDFMTHSIPTKNGNKLIFCYDFGYLELKNDQYKIIKIDDIELLEHQAQ